MLRPSPNHGKQRLPNDDDDDDQDTSIGLFATRRSSSPTRHCDCDDAGFAVGLATRA